MYACVVTYSFNDIPARLTWDSLIRHAGTPSAEQALTISTPYPHKHARAPAFPFEVSVSYIYVTDLET